MIIDNYDLKAPKYDSLYSSEEHKKEDNALFTAIENRLGESEIIKLIDLGCGTGLLLDHIDLNKRGIEYLGIEPSKGMIKEFKKKHPNKEIINGYWRDFDAPYDMRLLVCGIYGVGDYLTPEEINHMTRGRRFILMFSSEDNESPVRTKEISAVLPNNDKFKNVSYKFTDKYLIYSNFLHKEMIKWT